MSLLLYTFLGNYWIDFNESYINRYCKTRKLFLTSIVPSL